ncbi:MAG: class I SAM-dependent methyltransferase [Acidobacteriia bacterium]|nr:class I SAM-dependent methyltransferase [Terriglobia bacterium]
MPGHTDEVWKTSSVVAVYLQGVRAAIPLAQEQIDIMLRLLAALGQPIRSFLDLGSGDGVLAAAILDRYPGAEGVLVDFSGPMIEAARNRFAHQNASVRFVNADYGPASWTGSVEKWGPYDAIVSGYSIHHQPDTRKRGIYAELFRLLRPGGIFINVEHVASASGWVASVHDDLFIDHLCHGRPGTSRAEIAETYYHRPDKEANILAPVELQCQWLREIGFADVDCYLKVFELAVFGGRRP